MKAIQKFSLVLIPLALISACKGLKVKDIKNNDPKTTLLVNNYKVECSSTFKLDLCLQIKVKKSSSAKWEEYAADIKNFAYQWGNDYEIEVTYTDLDPKPVDAPSRKYKFSKLIVKTKAPNTDSFKLTVSRDTTADLIKKSTTDDTIYKIFDEIDIKCDPAVECTTLEDNITQDNAIKFILSHNDNLSNPLNIEDIPCTSGRDSFDTDCK